jgi:hypothetical protein
MKLHKTNTSTLRLQAPQTKVHRSGWRHSDRRRFVVGMQVSQTKRDYVPAKLAESGFRLWQGVEPGSQLTIEGLFGDIASLIERIESVGEAIIQDRETGDLFPKELF